MHPGPTSRTNQASLTGGGGRAGLVGGAGRGTAVITAPHFLLRSPPTLGPLITNSSPSLSHSIPPTRYHSLHFLVFSASALAGEERRSGFLVGFEAERSPS
jgi:hypothetical protein